MRYTLDIVSQLKEKLKDSKTEEWKNLKGAVWHESFKRLLQVLEVHARLGFNVQCGDGIKHTGYFHTFSSYRQITKNSKNMKTVICFAMS